MAKRTLSDKQIETLRKHQFQPGQSGNPAGGSRCLRLRSHYIHLLDQPYPRDRKKTWGEAIARALFEAAVEDKNIAAIREVADRVGGRPPQPVNFRSDEPFAYLPDGRLLTLSDMARVDEKVITAYLRRGAAEMEFPLQINPGLTVNNEREFLEYLDGVEKDEREKS